MKVSLNIVKSFIETELPAVDELVQRINERLGGVENIIDLNAKYKDAKIVRVVECEKHPDADKLSLCQVDAGTGELVQVVCGAPNVTPTCGLFGCRQSRWCRQLLMTPIHLYWAHVNFAAR